MPDERLHRVIFLDPKLFAAYGKLGEGTWEERELHSRLEEAVKDLKKNPACGIKIPSNVLPKEYIRMGIDNLRKIDLPHGWRLIYTLTGDKVEIVAIILEWFSHKEYAKRFGYKVG